jgi:hypothetical protein
MKKLILGLGFLAVVILGLGFVVWAKVHVHQQQAIIAVLNEANAANTQKIEYSNGQTRIVHPNSPLFSVPVYTKRLRQISTLQCPEPFQMAWLNFIQTLERLERPFAGLGSLIEFTVSTVHPDGSGTSDALARLDKLDLSEARMRIQRVALRYGVQIH